MTTATMLLIPVGTTRKHGDVQNVDEKILNHDDVEDDEVEDLMEDTLQLQSGFGEKINNANNKLQYLQEGEF